MTDQPERRSWTSDTEPPDDVTVVEGDFSWPDGTVRHRYLVRGLATGWTGMDRPSRRFIDGIDWETQAGRASGPLSEVRIFARGDRVKSTMDGRTGTVIAGPQRTASQATVYEVAIDGEGLWIVAASTLTPAAEEDRDA